MAGRSDAPQVLVLGAGLAGLGAAYELQRAGFRVTVLTDCIAGVERVTGDSERAIDDMKAAGADMTTAAQFIA